jgi:hypothetical protein
MSLLPLLACFFKFLSSSILQCCSCAHHLLTTKFANLAKKLFFNLREVTNQVIFVWDTRACGHGDRTHNQGRSYSVSRGCKGTPKISKISYSDQIFTIYTPPWHHSMHPQGKYTLLEFSLASPLLSHIPFLPLHLRVTCDKVVDTILLYSLYKIL